MNENCWIAEWMNVHKPKKKMLTARFSMTNFGMIGVFLTFSVSHRSTSQTEHTLHWRVVNNWFACFCGNISFCTKFVWQSFSSCSKIQCTVGSDVLKIELALEEEEEVWMLEQDTKQFAELNDDDFQETLLLHWLIPWFIHSFIHCSKAIGFESVNLLWLLTLVESACFVLGNANEEWNGSNESHQCIYCTVLDYDTYDRFLVLSSGGLVALVQSSSTVPIHYGSRLFICNRN